MVIELFRYWLLFTRQLPITGAALDSITINRIQALPCGGTKDMYLQRSTGQINFWFQEYLPIIPSKYYQFFIITYLYTCFGYYFRQKICHYNIILLNLWNINIIISNK